ncbi:MAG: hypothetical protein KKA31_00430 [Candidatus Margulisbacteria bacterium]|nr:hypothetical protein [Candidatus Margulisiibacteriota bacterium]
MITQQTNTTVRHNTYAYSLFHKSNPRNVVSARICPVHSISRDALKMWGSSLPPDIRADRPGMDIYAWQKLRTKMITEEGSPYTSRLNYYLGIIDQHGLLQAITFAKYKGSHFFMSVLQSAPWNHQNAQAWSIPAVSGSGAALIAHICQLLIAKHQATLFSQAILLRGTFPAAPFYRQLGFIEADTFFCLGRDQAIHLAQAAASKKYRWWNLLNK